MTTREQECLKCHKKFNTAIDKMGVPYKKICPKCTESNRYVRCKEGRGIFRSKAGIKG